MKRLYIVILLVVFYSCNKYGKYGDGKGNLRFEMLKEKCKSKTSLISFLFLRPETTTTCYMVYDDEKFTGSTAEYYSNGQLKFITNFIEGREDVESRKEYFDNGQIVSEIVRTPEIIEYKTYYSNGNIEELRHESLLNSSFNFEKIFHKNGNLKTLHEYNKRQEFFEDGELKSEHIQLENYNFKQIEYFSNRQLKYKEIRDDLFEFKTVYTEDGYLIEFFKNDSIHIKNNPKTLAKIFEGKYKNRLKEGEWVYFFKNGSIKSVGNYSEGTKIGTHIYYHNNGQLLKKINYQNGDINGELKEYFKNGKLKSKANYINGNINGKYLEYHDNGKLKADGYYQYGFKIGLFKFYNKKGDLESAETF